jgi:hypothetical protein
MNEQTGEWTHVDRATLEALAESNGTGLLFTAAFVTTELPDGRVYFTERHPMSSQTVNEGDS